MEETSVPAWAIDDAMLARSPGSSLAIIFISTEKVLLHS